MKVGQSNLAAIQDFSFVWNQETLAFLDLELCHEHNNIFVRNYTKPTAGNSYLHYDSCHHPLWVKNIPKGQFCRLRQNCTKDSDYILQSAHLKQKFLEKGYPEPLIDHAYNIFLPEKNPKLLNHPKNLLYVLSPVSMDNTKKWNKFFQNIGTYLNKTPI